MFEENIQESQGALDKWRERIIDVPESQPGAPITVLAGEAIALEDFLKERWEPKKYRNGLAPVGDGYQ